MRDLLEKLKAMAGAINQIDLLNLIYTGHKGEFFYYNPNHRSFIGWEAEREVFISRTPADIVSVEWKQTNETFGDFVRRKTQLPEPKIPEPQIPEPKIPESVASQLPDTSEMDKVMGKPDNDIRKNAKV